jgi:hypothetical protein
MEDSALREFDQSPQHEPMSVSATFSAMQLEYFICFWIYIYPIYQGRFSKPSLNAPGIGLQQSPPPAMAIIHTCRIFVVLN